jgi:hypothetical protein
VWAGLKGTNSYAWASELVPVVVLAAAIRWRGLTVLRAGLGKFWAVWGATAVVLVMLVAPLARAAKGLTTTSLGSCDAADYGAGARVLMEFARGERGGFMGLTEVVRVMSVDNFFDYWTRLNHFAPAALIALNGTILDCAPHELTSLMTMVILAGSVPVVLWCEPDHMVCGGAHGDGAVAGGAGDRGGDVGGAGVVAGAIGLGEGGELRWRFGVGVWFGAGELWIYPVDRAGAGAGVCGGPRDLAAAGEKVGGVERGDGGAAGGGRGDFLGAGGGFGGAARAVATV